MTISEEMKVATQWGSHLPTLLACIAVTKGPVLEIGVGHFSTPHLHALCVALGRNLISIESNQQWREDFEAEYAGAKHAFVKEWVHLRDEENWGVAFIDDVPGGEHRAKSFKALIECSEFVVMHDAQKDSENFQAVEPMLLGLNWHLCNGYFPHTLCASKTRQIPEVLKGM